MPECRRIDGGRGRSKNPELIALVGSLKSLVRGEQLCVDALMEIVPEVGEPISEVRVSGTDTAGNSLTEARDI
jgi:hypothetical protein